MRQLYKNIKDRRKKLGMSQEELAKKVGYSGRSMIAKIEAGEIDLYQSKVDEIAYALGTTAKELNGYEINDAVEYAEKMGIQLGNYIDADELNQSKKTNIVDFIQNKLSRKVVTINVLGSVAAGIPIEAIEDIVDTEEITSEIAKTGEFFGLRIKGDSMSPRILDGDTVIIRKQNDVESGDIAIVLINNNEATCKKLTKHENGVTLSAYNPAYEPIFFSNKEIKDLPVIVIGKVVELRGKF